MKLLWKAECKNLNQLDKGKLPLNAVKYKEPDSFLWFNLTSMLYGLLLLPAILIFAAIKTAIGFDGFSFSIFNNWGFVLAIVAILPHELIHAFCYPKNAEVELWYSKKHLIAFVHSTFPMTKNRFLFVSISPMIILGVLPLIIWSITDFRLSAQLFSFGGASLLFCAGDLMNIVNTLRQVPKNGMIQNSGLNSFWFVDESEMKILEEAT
jgi:hypothetical protein